MGRPKKEKPNHGKYFEVKKTIGHNLNGDPIRKSFYSLTSKADAAKQGEDWIVANKVAEQTGEPFIEREYTFAEWARKWLEVYKKPNVDINTYKLTYEGNVNHHLIPYFGKAKMDDIKPIDIQHFFDLRCDLSQSVLDKLHMCLVGIFESGMDNDVCRKNPAKKIRANSSRKKNTKHVYTDSQIEKVKQLSKRSSVPEAYVILNTGVRREEIVGFQWTDFDKKNKCISVNRALADVQDKSHRFDDDNIAPGLKMNPPKWNSYRTIPLNDECVAFIDALPRNGPYVFPKEDGSPQGPNAWGHKLCVFMRNMHALNPDIPVLSAHELRHTFATSLRRRGVDIYTIQKVMGHRDINMDAQIYIHNEQDVLRRNMKLGTGVVQMSHKRKFKVKWVKRKATQIAK